MRHFCIEKNRVAMGWSMGWGALRDWVGNRHSWSSVTKPHVFIQWGRKLLNPFQKPYVEQIRKKKFKTFGKKKLCLYIVLPVAPGNMG